MARIPSSPGMKQQPKIDRDAVLSFFEQRASKVDILGPVRAVIYQDKHADLAEQRDAAEKKLVAPLLALEGKPRLIDIGCGTGRWVDEIAPHCSHYHGIDASQGLIAHARRLHADYSNCRFSVALADEISLETLNETRPFERILCAGVMIYLNDENLSSMLRAFEQMSASSARIVIREPMGIEARLTIQDHYSDDMEQTYNAIYRTEGELLESMQETLLSKGFEVLGSGDVYESSALNNRSETRQRWLVLERRE